MDIERPLFSQRLRASKCPHCGPGMGMFARDVPVLGHEERKQVVAVMCRWCGGHWSTRDGTFPP